MPPVALTLASVPAPLSPRTAPALTECPSTEHAATGTTVPVALPEPALIDPPAVPTRPHLRLVTSAPATTEVHGHGGPTSCRCRDCVMARHPAFLPRLKVVR